MKQTYINYKDLLNEVELKIYQTETIDKKYIQNLADELFNLSFIDLYCRCLQIICSYYYHELDRDNFVYFLDKFKKINDKNNEFGQIYIYMLEGLYSYLKLENAEGVRTAKQSLALYHDNKCDDQLLLCKLKYNLGLGYFKIEDYITAFKYFLEALKCDLHKSCVYHKAFIYQRIGTIESFHGNNKDALFNYLKSAEILKKNSIFTSSYVSVLNFISSLYFKLKKDDEAYQYLIDALQRATELNLDSQKIISLSQLGNYYVFKANFEKAEESLLSAISIAEKQKDANLSYSLLVLGELYIKMERYDEALQLFNKSLKLLKKLKMNFGIHHLYCRLARLYFQIEDNEKGEEYLIKAEKLLPKITDIDSQKTMYKLFIDYYNSIKNYEKALEYSKLYIALIEQLNDAHQRTYLDFFEIKNK